jgi:hypothetical protein
MSAGFEPAIPAIKWLQTYALDRTVTEICNQTFLSPRGAAAQRGPGPPHSRGF